MAAVALAACGGSSKSSSTTVGATPTSAATATTAAGHTIQGIVRLVQSGQTFQTPCQGTGGYSELSDGTGVDVLDGSGDRIGKGELAQSTGNGEDCLFSFSVHVPDAGVYTVRVVADLPAPNTDMGSERFTSAELEAKDWNIGTIEIIAV